LEAVQASIAPTKQLLDICRRAGLTIFHTREGHKPDLSDCPSSKLHRQTSAPNNTQHKLVIGDQGKMGRLLVRGEYGHDIVDELKPLPGEVVIDKPGKGSFWNTTILHKLKARAITHLIVSGVTTECCFATSIREANDRGFECCKCLCFKPPAIQLSVAPNLFCYPLQICFTLALQTSNNLSATKLMNLIKIILFWLSMQMVQTLYH